MSIRQLVEDLLDAKAAESAARSARVEVEERLLALLPVRDEGSVTEKHDGCKVTVTYPVNRTIDPAALAAVRASVPAALYDQAIEYAPKLNLSGLKSLRNNEPEVYAILAEAITAKPGKPSVKVEVIE